jgi:tetrahydromethanopterin S-methyltransferase subunit B
VIIPASVTLTGSATDVWIFQIAQNLDLSSATQVILSGNAQPRNIFWIVTGQTTLGTTSVMNGNILCATAIVLQTGATLNGRALAQTAVTLDASTIVVPTNPPTVSSTNPISDATGVFINTAISATFSTAMDPSTITHTTFTLKQGTTAVSGSVSYSGVTAVFNPNSNLSVSTVYTATITTGAEDLSDNALASNYVWNFTTGTTADTTAPTVISVIPTNTATGVANNSVISAIFSKAMDPTKISLTTFILKQGTTAISGIVSYSGVTAIFTPSALAISTTYTAVITTGAKDLAGNALASNYTWTFTTGTAPDTSVPAIISISPTNGSTRVALKTAITITFNKTMNPLTITTTTITVKNGTTLVLGTVTYSGMTAIFTPTSNFTANTIYTVTITTGAKDLIGHPLARNYVTNFNTGGSSIIAGYDVGIVLGLLGLALVGLIRRQKK